MFAESGCRKAGQPAELVPFGVGRQGRFLWIVRYAKLRVVKGRSFF